MVIKQIDHVTNSILWVFLWQLLSYSLFTMAQFCQKPVVLVFSKTIVKCSYVIAGHCKHSYMQLCCPVHEVKSHGCRRGAIVEILDLAGNCSFSGSLQFWTVVKQPVISQGIPIQCLIGEYFSAFWVTEFSSMKNSNSH